MSENNHLPCFTQPEFSPMTEISINLSSTKISHLYTRKRRLSLDEGDDFSKDSFFNGRKGLQDVTNTRCDGEISLYGGATPETRSPESSPEQRSKKCNKYFDRTSSLDSGIGSSFQTQKSFDVSKDELLEVECLDNQDGLPINFNNLVSGSILLSSNKNYRTPPRVRNRLFVSSPQTTPLTHNKENDVSQKSNRLFVSSPQTTPLTHNKENDEVVSEKTKEQAFKLLKRSKSLFDNEIQQNKRYKFTEPGLSTPKFRRCISTCSPNTIMSAVQRSAVETNLIGDCSKPFLLPLVSGRHQDLKSISPSTLANLIQGQYSDSTTYKIIDCRYPYEYNAGHIQSALNYYTTDQIESNLFNPKKDTPIPSKDGKREIIIFHCEFSHKRGPKMFRFLRTLDRNHNDNVYPALYYPEMYLLEGGYKNFFEGFSELCDPVAYLRMDAPEYENECRQFRAHKKSCSNPAIQNNRKLVTKRSALEF